MPSGIGIAPYTVPTAANKLKLITSQRDLLQSYGNPYFHTIEGTPIHGDELNEYGLHAAHSYLGIANRAYVLRCDVDLGQLAPSTTSPVNLPNPGTYWLDLSTTQFGLFQSNGDSVPGSAWVPRTVTLPDATQLDNNYVPLASFGKNGDFAVVTYVISNYFYERIANVWLQVGTAAWNSAHPTDVVGSPAAANLPVNSSIKINNVPVTLPSTGAVDVATAISGAGIPGIIGLVSNGGVIIRNTTGSSITLANVTGTPLVTLGLKVGTTNGATVSRTSSAQFPSGSRAGDVWVKGTSSNRGAQWNIRYFNGNTGLFNLISASFHPFDSTLVDGLITKDIAAATSIPNVVAGSLYVGYDVVTGDQQVRRWNGTTWATLVYEASLKAPVAPPSDGTLWYNTDLRVDFLVGDGEHWNGYLATYSATDPGGCQIAGSAPSLQSTGAPLVDNDLWINSSDTENYPALYRFSASNQRWFPIDKTDLTSPFGMISADARANSGPHYGAVTGYVFESTSTADMLLSDYVEPDAPDPRLHPAGILLFNTRYSMGNVKEWKPNYFAAGGFDPNTDFTKVSYNIGDITKVFPALVNAGRWVTASGNAIKGAPNMLRKAVRAMVVRAMAATIVGNQDIRNEISFYNLVAAPGYPEMISEMVTLNTDQREIAFIVGDTPCRLTPDGTSITTWASNGLNVSGDGEDGLVTANDYVGVYYPWGLGTDLSGNFVMIPPSTIAMRTMAYNDQVAFPWFAPAGFTRGLVTNASSVGYLNSAGEYVSTILNPSQRDVIYTSKINPIAYIPQRGLVVYGQKTLAPLSTSLDRINVARLANYIKYNLAIIVKPYLFEQNDHITRLSAKHTVERFFNSLIGQRAIADYVVQCDETNNTPSRIDQNQLWIDAAAIPLKSVEFIYVPVRLLTTGSSLTG